MPTSATRFAIPRRRSAVQPARTVAVDRPRHLSPTSTAKLVADQVISLELCLSLKDCAVALQQPSLQPKDKLHGSYRP